MYRLLIVDDEHYVVDWLAELFAGQEKMELEIYKAYLAREALAILERYKIDIVLSDIKMPGIDGFELADRIRSNWPTARIIFLTGHSEFEYAYKANQYRNISFFLKTEDDDVIVDSVAAAIESLLQEKKSLEMIGEYVTMQNLVHWQITKNIIVDWLEKGRETLLERENERSDMSCTLDYEKKNVVLSIHLTEFEESATERQKAIVLMQQLLHQLVSERAHIFLLDFGENNYLGILQEIEEKKIEEEGRLVLFVKEMLDEFSQACLESLSVHALFIVYDGMVTWQNTGEKYELLKSAAMLVADAGELYGGRIIGKAEEMKLQADNILLLERIRMRSSMSKLQNYLEQGKKELFFVEFEKIHLVIGKITNRHSYPAIELYQFFSFLYLSYMNRKKLVEKLAFRIAPYKLFSGNDFATWEDAFSYLREIGQLLFEYRVNDQQKRNDEFLEGIRQIIKNNLGEELSLTYISSCMNYNPSYISRLFKQLSGVNLSDYINESRMEFAKKRLREGKDTIQKIADAVGFDSSQYFSAAFKKAYGITPGDYRHHCKNIDQM